MTSVLTPEAPLKTRAARAETARPLADREPLASPREVAAYLGQSEKTLEAWRARGFGPRFIRVGTGVRYRWSDIDAFLDENTVEPGVAA